MLLTCPICESWSVYSVCSDCRKIRHYMSIYSKERVIEILDSILSRTEDKQQNKLKFEIKNEIDNKQNALLSELKAKIKEK